MIEIRAARPADAAAIADIHVDAWQVAHAGVLSVDSAPDQGYDARLAEWKKTLVRSPQGIFLAEDDKLGPMGFVSCGLAHEAIRIEAGSFRGEIYALYVRPVCQGLGLGKELFEAALVNLGRAGFSAVMLRVLADNPSAGFFERMGGQPIGERMVELGGQTLREIAYGWGGKLPKPAKAEKAGKPR